MADLSMLLTPVVIGLFFGQAAFLLSNPLRESEAGFSEPEEYPKEWDEPQRETWEQAKAGARADALKMARRAMEACPDVSCDQVAEAFGLPKMSVRRLSRGGRTGKKVQTNYSHDEIREMAGSV